jgi:hypothetical protein
VNTHATNAADEPSLKDSARKLWLSLTAELLIRLFPRKYSAGRHSNPFPVQCNDCGLVARQMDCVHAYEDDGSGHDVVGVEECRHCGSTDLE